MKNTSRHVKFQNGWASGLPETPCGFGSTLEATEIQRKWIPEIVKKYEIGSIADIGAGDRNWIKHIDLGDVEYAAYDLIPRDEHVVQFDLVTEIPPKVDMLMCLWVLNHMPYEQRKIAARNLKSSGSRYLLVSDRPAWNSGKPPELHVDHIEELVVEESTMNRLLLIDFMA